MVGFPHVKKFLPPYIVEGLTDVHEDSRKISPAFEGPMNYALDILDVNVAGIQIDA